MVSPAEGMDSNPFVHEGIRRGVARVPSVAFTVDQSLPSNGFRMGYSTLSDEQIIRGVEILGQLTHEWLSEKQVSTLAHKRGRQTAAGAETESEGRSRISY